MTQNLGSALKLIRLWLIVCMLSVLMGCSPAILAQSRVAVTATVTGANSAPFSYGTYQVQLVDSNNSIISNIVPTQTQFSGALTSTGSLALSIYPNSAFLPPAGSTGTQWRFTICSAPTTAPTQPSQCYASLVTINASGDYSSAVSTGAPAIYWQNLASGSSYLNNIGAVTVTANAIAAVTATADTVVAGISVTAPNIIGSLSAAKSTTFVFDGDSLAYGQGLTLPAQSYPTQFGTRSFAGQMPTIVNLGVVGETIATMLSNYPTAVRPYCVTATASKPVYMHLEGGINSLYAGVSAASVLADTKSYWALATADGCTMIAATLTPAATVTGANEMGRQTVNDGIRASVGLYSYLDDLDQLLPDDTNNTWYQTADHVHYTAAATSKIADFINGILTAKFGFQPLEKTTGVSANPFITTSGVTNYNAPADDNVMVFNSALTSFHGPYFVMGSATNTHTGTGPQGAFQIRYGDFTAVAPGSSVFDVAYVNNSALTSAIHCDTAILCAFGGRVSVTTGGSANHAICWKADGKTLGFCSAVVASDGTCGTCN